MFHVWIALLRLVTWLKHGQLVWLEDTDGQRCLRTAYRWPDGLLRANRHKGRIDSSCILLSDGSVPYHVNYVKCWHRF